MGEISKDIARITEPSEVTLSGAPNFVIFENKRAGEPKSFLQFTISQNYKASDVTDAFIDENMYILLYDYQGQERSFHATRYPDQVRGSYFLITDDLGDNAENIRNALISDSWVAANYDVTIPFNFVNGSLVNGRDVNVQAKGASLEFDISIDTNNGVYPVTWVSSIADNKDTISGQNAEAVIALDIYEDTGIFLGEDGRATSSDKLGSFVFPVNKTYIGAPLWFDVNGIFSKMLRYNKPPLSGWFDAGSMMNYRFIAKLKGANNFSFYQSSVLYVISGVSKKLTRVDLSPYIYQDGGTVVLLSNKPRTTHVKGQKQYLNFILSDPLHTINGENNFTLNIAYELYTFSGEYIETIYDNAIQRAALFAVSTCVLDLDKIIEAVNVEVGIVKVALSRNGAAVSNFLEFEVLPDCLHEIAYFSFMNALGGWDSYNFDAGVQSEVKESSTSYFRTLTPYLTKGDSLEVTHTKTIDKSYTIEGAPVTLEVATWLEELAASKVLLTSDGDYAIIEDFKLSIKDARDLQTPTIKYKLTDTPYND